MLRNVVAVTGVAALLGLTVACTSKSSTPLSPTTPNTGGSSSTAADGSTLKASAPVPQSPVGGAKPQSPATLRVSVSSASYSAAALPPQYRFQVFNSANVMVENALVNLNSYPVVAELVVNQTYTWKARAELNGYIGPWSSIASFVAPETAFLGVSTFADPLTNGRTVGVMRGGSFTPQGWKASNENDGIDYDLQSPCVECVLEFDVSGFGKAEGEFLAKDLKWITMGDASAFGSFGAFRDHPWKMHLEQRSDFDGSGMKLIWRNGDVGGSDPGDHDTKLYTTNINWNGAETYHFRLEWDGGGYAVFVNGEEYFGGGFNGPYAPPAHRVSLGCWRRSETMFGTYRNVKLRALH